MAKFDLELTDDERPTAPFKRDGFFVRLSKKYWLMSCVGAVLIGVTLPCALVTLRHLPGGATDALNAAFDDGAPNVAANSPRPIREILSQAALIQVFATIFCGPGALILALVIYGIMKAIWRNYRPRMQNFMFIGMALGGLLAFTNFPGYLSAALLGVGDKYLWLRVCLLFFVTGATCGSWIAWQAYRSYESNVGFFPRYSLKTLLIVVFLWGALLSAFAPRGYQ